MTTYYQRCECGHVLIVSPTPHTGPAPIAPCCRAKPTNTNITTYNPDTRTGSTPTRRTHNERKC